MTVGQTIFIAIFSFIFGMSWSWRYWRNDVKALRYRIWEIQNELWILQTGGKLGKYPTPWESLMGTPPSEVKGMKGPNR